MKKLRKNLTIKVDKYFTIHTKLLNFNFGKDNFLVNYERNMAKQALEKNNNNNSNNQNSELY
jgi:hypothetical protein